MLLYDSNDSILRQFSPLERKPLLRWLWESNPAHRQVHPAYRLSLVNAGAPVRLDNRAKIGFVLFQEFGNCLSAGAMALLIERVNRRLQKLV